MVSGWAEYGRYRTDPSPIAQLAPAGWELQKWLFPPRLGPVQPGGHAAAVEVVHLLGRQQTVHVADRVPAPVLVLGRGPLADAQGVAGAVGDRQDRHALAADVEDAVGRPGDLLVGVAVAAGHPQVAGHGPVTGRDARQVLGDRRAEEGRDD